MKRNLFAIFLALALVVALAFVVAPNAKAETETPMTVVKATGTSLPEGFDFDKNILDLNGQNVTVAVPNGKTLSVIDSTNKGADGTNAGSLTNTGADSVLAYEGNYNGTRFLKVVTNTDKETGAKTYAFHPCFVRIDMIGVNTSKSALCLKVTYMTNKAAQGYIGATGIMYGADPENLTSAADTFGAFSFEGTVMTAYFDLIGSLDNETAIGESRVFKAYFKSDDQVVANLPIEISPAKVLKDLDDKADTFEQPQKDKMVAMLTGKAHLEALCPNFLGNASATPIIADGKYHIVAKYADGNYYAMTDNCVDKANLKAEKITLNNGVVTGNATAWTITNDGEGNVTLMSPKGVYLMRQDNSSNIFLGQTAVKWLVAKNEAKGTYTLQNTDTDERCLSYNGKVKGFKAYGVSTEHVIELLIIPANEDAPQPEYLLLDGKYNVVVEYTGDKYFAMTGTYDKPKGCMTATNVTVSEGIVTGDATAWTLTNDGMGNVTLMSPEGKYLIRDEDKSNILLGETAEKWLVAKDEKTGFYTLQHTNIDVRYLAYNGTGFKAYEEANDVRVIELLIVPVG